jgi:acylphosphatase
MLKRMEGRRIIISGEVQGVSFRYGAKQQAEALGLSGWVRNRRDGRVELAAFGEKRALARLADWCRQGPAAAAVDEVRTEALAYEARSGFTIEG